MIADHIRACAFTVADGVIPGNEGRGYVLRRIARRAIRHGYKLGARKPFFLRLVDELVRQMGEAYPELRQQQARITDVLKQEEERFFQTIANGMEILERALAALSKQGGTLDGELAFKLHDTYGFPLDLTADVCRERGVTVDGTAFDAAMNRQRAQARAAGKFKMAAGLEYKGQPTTFHGYEHLVHEGAKVTAVYVDGTQVERARAGDDAVVVLDHTPFYAESGGQVGDTGELRNNTSRFIVEDTQKIQADVYGHHGRVVEGEIKPGDAIAARVDGDKRAKTIRNHSATHLMHKALREVLGSHVQQKGSLVDAERTRFDFAHNAPMTDEQIRGRGGRQCRDPGQCRNAGAGDAHRRSPEGRRDDALRREVRRRGARARRTSFANRAAARTCSAPATSACSRSWPRAVGGVRRVEAVMGVNALAYLQSLESSTTWRAR